MFVKAVMPVVCLYAVAYFACIITNICVCIAGSGPPDKKQKSRLCDSVSMGRADGYVFGCQHQAFHQVHTSNAMLVGAIQAAVNR